MSSNNEGGYQFYTCGEIIESKGCDFLFSNDENNRTVKDVCCASCPGFGNDLYFSWNGIVCQR